MVDDTIRIEIAAICSDVGWIRLAILFGSRATGKASTGSDFDVAVLASREVTLAEELTLASRVSAVTRTEVDIVRLDSAEPLVAREVALNGVRIYEVQPGLFTAWRARAISEWLDFNETMAPFHARFLRRLAGGA